MNRRDALKIAGGSVAMALTLEDIRIAGAAVGNKEDLRLGVATYSLRNFQRQMAISMLKQLEVSVASVKDVHLPYSLTPEEATKAKKDFEKAGITIVSGGVIHLDDQDQRGLRSYFEYARLCGMPMIIGMPTHKALGQVEKLVREFDIKLAIHNHGPEDKNFPTPQSALQAVKSMDARCGLCIDLGHSMRAGADVVQAIAEAGPRLFDIHIKDLRSPTDGKSQCDLGRGVMPVVAIFKQLKKMRYAGSVNLEYEINAENPLPGMASSLAYMRGVLAGLAG